MELLLNSIPKTGFSVQVYFFSLNESFERFKTKKPAKVCPSSSLGKLQMVMCSFSIYSKKFHKGKKNVLYYSTTDFLLRIYIIISEFNLLSRDSFSAIASLEKRSDFNS